MWNKENYELKESDLKVSMTPPVLYDLYERQKLTETKMMIYKTYADQDELSKIVAMKNALGMTEKEIEENFNMLIKEKQLVAVADYFADQISPENPPAEIKSPIKLKSDVDSEYAIHSGKPLESGADGNENLAGAAPGGAPAEGEGAPPEGEGGGGEPAEPTFGLEGI